MASTITFHQLEEQWPLPNLASLADLIEDRERSESLRALLDAHDDTLSDLYDCAGVLFDHGFLKFDFAWGQNDADVEIALPLPKNVQTSSIQIQQGTTSVSVTLKPFRAPILDGTFWERIDIDESQWTVERRASAALLKIEMHKRQPIWWTKLFQDDGVDRQPEPPCQDALRPAQAYTYAQTMEMTLSDQPAKVFAMYKLAADVGHPLAASRIGNAYIEGDVPAGVAKDQAAALHYLMIGAENGHYECMFQVGHAFHHGIVFERDFDKAVFWYTQAAEADRHVLAAYFLGLIYHWFDGRAPNPAKAVYWWQRAAKQGHPDSTFNLALYYYTGTTGVDADRSKALDLFKNVTVTNASYIELMHENGINLEALEAEVAAAAAQTRPVPAARPGRLRRRRSKKRASWIVALAGVTAVGAVVVAGLAWYNREAIRQWNRSRTTAAAPGDRQVI